MRASVQSSPFDTPGQLAQIFVGLWQGGLLRRQLGHLPAWTCYLTLAVGHPADVSIGAPGRRSSLHIPVVRSILGCILCPKMHFGQTLIHPAESCITLTDFRARKRLS